MRFLIAGAGAIGGYIGAKMARAGADVTLFARGPHLKAMQECGLRVLSEDGWRLVRAGITTPEEVMRVTKDQALNNVATETEPKPAIEVHAPKKAHAPV